VDAVYVANHNAYGEQAVKLYNNLGHEVLAAEPSASAITYGNTYAWYPVSGGNSVLMQQQATMVPVVSSSDQNQNVRTGQCAGHLR